MNNTKWFVITDIMPDNILYVGINDDSYYGDGDIISEHNTQEQADAACIEYAKENHLPTFSEYKVGKILMEVITP